MRKSKEKIINRILAWAIVFFIVVTGFCSRLGTVSLAFDDINSGNNIENDDIISTGTPGPTKSPDVFPTSNPQGGFYFEIDSIDGHLNGAVVEIKNSEDKLTGTYFTDMDGKALITEFAALGELEENITYKFRVSKLGYIPQEGELNFPDRNNYLSDNIYRYLNKVDNVSISGNIVDEDNNPINVAGMPVSLKDNISKEVIDQSYTDSEGNWIIKNVPNYGGYLICITDEDYNSDELEINLTGESDSEINPVSIVATHKKEQSEFEFEVAEPSPITYEDTVEGFFENKISEEKQGEGTGEITYSITSGEEYADIDPDTGKLKLKKAGGEVTVKAVKASDNEFAKATAEYSILIEYAENNTLKFAEQGPIIIKYNESCLNTASSSKGSGAITYSITNRYEQSQGIINSLSGEFKSAAVGKVEIKAVQEMDNFYKGAAACYDIIINKAEQTDFKFENPTPSDIKTTYKYFTNSASGNSFAGNITYRIVDEESDSNVADINNHTGRIEIKKAGKLVVEASNKGNDNYEPASIRYNLRILRSDDNSFRFECSNPAPIKYQEKFKNPAVSSNETTAITYKIDESCDAGVASVDQHGELTINKAGKVKVIATRALGDRYGKKSIFYELEILKGAQADIRFVDDTPKKLTYGDTWRFNVEGGTTNNAVVYSIVSGSEYAEITEDGILTTKGAGSIQIKATMPGNDCYEDVSETHCILIDKAEQSPIVFKYPNPDPVYCKEKLENPVIEEEGGRYSEGEITYTIIENAKNAEIDDEKCIIKTKRHGDITVQAKREGDDNYKEAVGEYKLTILPLEQTDFEFEPCEQDKVIIGTDFSRKVSGKQSSGIVRYGIVEGNELAKVDSEGNIYYIGGGKTGKVKVSAQKDGDDVFGISDEKFYEIDFIYDDIPENPYTILGEKSSNKEWYTENITINPPKGEYKISLGVSCDWDNWKDSLIYDIEGTSSLTIYLRNIKTGGITQAILIEDIRIDKTAPVLDSMSITYDLPVAGTILQSISMGFYKAPVKVSIEATDNESGIEGFEYSYLVIDEEKDKNEGKEKVKIEKKDIVYSEDGKTAKASFEIPAQFYGTVSFTAVDAADNSSTKNDTKVIVVDDISPDVKIKYNAPSGVVDGVTLETVNNVSENSILFYNNGINAIITVDENNFFEGIEREIDGTFDINSDIKVYVEKKDSLDTVHKIEYVPYQINNEYNLGTDKKQIEWTEKDGIYKAELVIEEEGEYVVYIEYSDKSGNNMKFSSETEEKAGDFQYTSNTMVIDKTPPELRIAGESDSNKYYKESKSITISAKEKYFKPSDLHISLKAEDIDGNTILGTEISKIISKIQDKANWTKGAADWWSIDVTFENDAKYILELSYKDMAGNQSKNNPSIEFVIDKLAPSTEGMGIYYSTSVIDKVIENITFGYYKASVKVTIKAQDNVSGIESMTYYYPLNDNVSVVNSGNSQGVNIDSSIIKYNGRKEAEYSFEIPAQYAGKVSFEATDRAGNKSSTYYGDRVVIVDSISPECNVVYEPVHIADAVTLKTKTDYKDGNSILYYNSNAEIKLEINEANFYPEDVKISIAKDKGTPYTYTPDKWDSNEDLRSTNIKLSENGDYILRIEYTDRSGNEMSSYVSEKIVIDKTKPQIQVEYNEDQIIQSINGIDYYDKAQTVRVKIDENNFRAEDVNVKVTAKNIEGDEVTVKNYSSYLKNQNNWIKSGGSYISEITYSEDANYTFYIEYTDLALNKSSVYSTDYFTVDKTAPENLKVSYGESVLETVLETVSFGFYDAPVTITITAEDETSGIQSFNYSYIKDENLTAQSTELLDRKIKEAQITYSNNNKKATAVFTVPRSEVSDFQQFRGNIEFTAVDKAALESEMKEKKKIVIDSISPYMEVTYNEPANVEEGIVYYKGEVTADFKITEANFYPEDVKISLEKDGNISDVTSVQWSQNQNGWTSEIKIKAPSDNSGDGSYHFIVNYEDHSGNAMEEYKSDLIVVDTKKPVTEITGVKDKSANNQESIGFVITAKDENFDIFTPELTAVIMNENGIYEEIKVNMGEIQTAVQGEEYRYVVDNLLEDGVYSFKCKVADKAGNVNDSVIMYDESDNELLKSYQEEEDILIFSVNRNGSTFTFNKEALGLIGRYYVQSVDKDISMEEINVDSLEEYEIYLNKEKLRKDTDYTVKEVKDEGSWHKYIYTLSKELFSEEGEYSVIASSKDKTGTVAYSDIKTAEINFVVDRTKPEIVVSGLENEGRYRTDVQEVTVIPKDPGGKIKEVKVIKGKNEELLNLSDNKLIEELEKNSEKLSFKVDNGINQKIEIRCMDEAGNESIHTYEKVTVSTDWYVLFYSNKPLFFGAVAGGGAVTAGGVSAVVLLRKGKLSILKKLFRK